MAGRLGAVMLMASAAPVTSAQGEPTLSLIDRPGRSAEVRIERAGERLRTRQVETTRDVLELLLDRRMAAIWPALTARFGADLVPLRDDMLARSATAYDKGRMAFRPQGFEALIHRRDAALLQRARILGVTGEGEQAVALLRADFAKRLAEPARDGTTRGIVATMLGSNLSTLGRVDEAIAALREAEAGLTASDALNLLLNRALLEARSGRHAAALATLERAETGLDATRRTLGGLLSLVPGSARYVASIRACALTGLGRAAEGEAALAPALVPDEPRSLAFPVSATNREVLLIGFLCMRDRERFTTTLLSHVASPASEMPAMWVQSAATDPFDENHFMDEVRRDPRIVAILARDVRLAPPELQPALDQWRR